MGKNASNSGTGTGTETDDPDTTSAEDAKITGTKGDAGTTIDPSDQDGEGDDDSDVEDNDAEVVDEPAPALEIPREVRRYVRRPLLWIPWALALGVLGYAMQVDSVQADEWVYGDGEPLTAVVAEEYDGPFVPLVYEHPVAGPVAVSIPNPDSDNPPQAGQSIAIRAHQTYPEQVRLAADNPDPAEWWMPVVPMVLVLLVVARARS